MKVIKDNYNDPNLFPIEFVCHRCKSVFEGESQDDFRKTVVELHCPEPYDETRYFIRCPCCQYDNPVEAKKLPMVVQDLIARRSK